jgi:hypothetical protein
MYLIVCGPQAAGICGTQGEPCDINARFSALQSAQLSDYCQQQRRVIDAFVGYPPVILSVPCLCHLPQVIGGARAPTPVGELGFVEMTQAVDVTDFSWRQVGTDHMDCIVARL